MQFTSIPSPEERLYTSSATGTIKSFTEMVTDGKNAFSPGGRYHIVSRILKDKPKVNLLVEVGCGGGETLAVQLSFAKSVIGFDLAIPEVLTSNPYPGIEMRKYNSNYPLPLSDGTVDVFTAMMVIEHLFDPFAFVSDVARVLKPGGLFFLNAPLIASLKTRLNLLIGNSPTTSVPVERWFNDRVWDGAHLHNFTLGTLKRLLEMYGFDVQRVQGCGKLVWLKNLRPSLFCAEVSIHAVKRAF